MKLRDIYVICKRNINIISKITLEATSGYVSGNRKYQVYITKDIVEAFNDLDTIPCLKNILIDFKAFKMLPKINDSVIVDYDDFTAKKSNLIKVIEIIISLYESINSDTSETIGLSIKLPPINDLTDFKNYISDLEFIFTKSPFSKTENEYFKFKKVDIGSFWIDLAVVSPSTIKGSVLLNNIAAFIDNW